jgi:hypothetical protein
LEGWKEDELSWVREEAIELCKLVEIVCVGCGCHVALTGGLLYKDGPRKDCDLLFYRIRQCDEIDIDKLKTVLLAIGVSDFKGGGWIYKATYNGKPLDCLFPEEQGGEYKPEER